MPPKSSQISSGAKKSNINQSRSDSFLSEGSLLRVIPQKNNVSQLCPPSNSSVVMPSTSGGRKRVIETWMDSSSDESLNRISDGTNFVFKIG